MLLRRVLEELEKNVQIFGISKDRLLKIRQSD